MARKQSPVGDYARTVNYGGPGKTTYKGDAKVAELDRNRVFQTWAGIPNCVGFDEKGRPLNRKGNVIPAEKRVEIHLQDGRFFATDGSELEEGDVPTEVRAWRGAMRAFPGITAPARVLECPQCPLKFPVKQWFIDHLRKHGMTEQHVAETLAAIEGSTGARLTVPWEEADFAPPQREPVAEGGLDAEGE